MWTSLASQFKVDSPCLNTCFLCVTPLTKFRWQLYGAANSYSSQDVADKRGQVRATPAPAGQEWQQPESGHSGTVGTFQLCWARQYLADDASGEPIMFCTFTSDQVIYRTDLIICCTSHIREKIIAIFISISCLTWPVVTTHFAYSLSSGNLIEIFLSNSLRFVLVLCPEVLLSLFPSGTY